MVKQVIVTTFAAVTITGEDPEGHVTVVVEPLVEVLADGFDGALAPPTT